MKDAVQKAENIELGSSSGEESDDKLVVEKPTEKWDCESILSECKSSKFSVAILGLGKPSIATNWIRLLKLYLIYIKVSSHSISLIMIMRCIQRYEKNI